jgi:hypothetical protein
MKVDDLESLSRPVRLMPETVLEPLLQRGVMIACNLHLQDRRYGCLGWINRATRDATAGEHVSQLTDELVGGEDSVKTFWRRSR